MSNTWQRWKNIMKCVPFEEKRLAKWNPPYIIQPKYDGFRCRAIPQSIITRPDHPPGHILLSSGEEMIFSVPHINEMLDKLKIQAELDGELYCHKRPFDGENGIEAICSRTVNLHSDYRSISYHVFDIVNELPQMRRLILIESLRGLHPDLVVAPFYLCESLEEILKIYDNLIEQGYEGIIVRQCDAPYVKKRSIWVMKFKPKQKDEYEIVGFKEEFSKDHEPKDTLGALICISGDGNVFDVGTGFTDERRKQLWEGRDLLIGQIAVVKYQHISSGRQVPRFPVFVEVKVKL